MLLSKVKRFFLDLFFPKTCLGCKRPDTYLCRDCFIRLAAGQNNIEIINNTCFICGKIAWQGKICVGCAKENGLDRLIAAAEYKNLLIRELIKSFKYHYVQELSDPLSHLLIEALKNINLEPNPQNFIIVPIPLHKHRLRYRGFNQAELLAKEVADYFKLPLENDILKRKTFATPQAKIKDTEKRKANLKNIFEIGSECSLAEKTVILVDDVATTGATLIEAAKTLKNSKAKEVWGLVVAKG